MFKNYYYFTSCEFFSPALDDGLSLEAKWQQVSSPLQDSSHYSGCSSLCSSLVGLDSLSDFQLFQLLSQALWTVPSALITIGITLTLMFRVFLVLWQGLSICLSFRFLWFSLCGLLGRQSPLYGGDHFMV